MRRPRPDDTRKTLREGIGRVADNLPAGTEERIERLTLRLPAGAGPDEVATALRAAVSPGGDTAGKTGGGR